MTTDQATRRLHALTEQLDAFTIVDPTRTWFRDSARRAHLYRNCPSSSSTGDDGSYAVRTDARYVWGHVPFMACPTCLYRSEERERPVLVKDALNATAILLARLRDAVRGEAGRARGRAGTLADALLTFGNANIAWANLDAAPAAPPAPAFDLAEAARVRPLIPDLGRILRELIEVRRAQWADAQPAEENELRYYCASVITHDRSGCMGDGNLDAPAFDTWDPSYIHGDNYDAETSDLASAAFERFRNELRRSGDIAAAKAGAHRQLASTPGWFTANQKWTRSYVNSWVTRLERVELEQQHAGRVTLRLAPMYGRNPWATEERALVRWLTHISPTGELTVTLPPILAEQVWNSYDRLRIRYSDIATVTLEPSADYDAQTIAVVNRFWTPSSAEPLASALTKAKLVCT